MSSVSQNIASTSVLRCLDIGGSKIVAADVSRELNIEVIARVPTPVNSFVDFSDQLSALCPDGKQPVGIAIAGVIHPATGIVISANIPCINRRNLAYDLSKRLARPVFLINDANAFALAEATIGQAAGRSMVFAAILGTGIGGAVVLNGRVIVGSDGTAGEWGHGPASTMRTGARLPKLKCNCGQLGCVDTLGGARGLERLYQHVTGAMASSHAILNHWNQGDTAAARVMDVYLDIVGGALANIVNTLSPCTVPVGGGLASNSDLVSALDKEVRTRSLGYRKSSLLYPALSGPEQAVIGAAIHTRQKNHARNA